MLLDDVFGCTLAAVPDEVALSGCAAFFMVDSGAVSPRRVDSFCAFKGSSINTLGDCRTMRSELSCAWAAHTNASEALPTHAHSGYGSHLDAPSRCLESLFPCGRGEVFSVVYRAHPRSKRHGANIYRGRKLPFPGCGRPNRGHQQEHPPSLRSNLNRRNFWSEKLISRFRICKSERRQHWGKTSLSQGSTALLRVETGIHRGPWAKAARALGRSKRGRCSSQQVCAIAGWRYSFSLCGVLARAGQRPDSLPCPLQ